MKKTILAAILLSGCVAQPQRPDIKALEEARERALTASIECGMRNVSGMDDGVSDASTVALALALQCNSEYLAVTEAHGDLVLQNDAQKRMWRQTRATRQVRVEAFLPIVLDHRSAALRNR